MFGLLAYSMILAAPVQDACPMISVSGRTEEKGRGSFSLDYSGGASGLKPTFAWSVSAGKIAAGQGSPSITVSGAPGQVVTGTLEVGGLPAACDAMASETIELGTIARPPS